MSQTEIKELATPLYQAIAGETYRLHIISAARFMLMSDGTNVEDRFNFLERSLALNTTVKFAQNIAIRDSLTGLVAGDTCYVYDSSGDPTSPHGAKHGACYMWLPGRQWLKLYDCNTPVQPYNFVLEKGGLAVDDNDKLYVDLSLFSDALRKSNVEAIVTKGGGLCVSDDGHIWIDAQQFSIGRLTDSQRATLFAGDAVNKLNFSGMNATQKTALFGSSSVTYLNFANLSTTQKQNISEAIDMAYVNLANLGDSQKETIFGGDAVIYLDFNQLTASQKELVTAGLDGSKITDAFAAKMLGKLILGNLSAAQVDAIKTKLGVATATASGLMAGTDKDKLDKIQAGAQVNPGNFGAASTAKAGSSGLVPAPAANQQGKFLRGDCTWADVSLPSFSVLNFSIASNAGNGGVLNYYFNGASSATSWIKEEASGQLSINGVKIQASSLANLDAVTCDHLNMISKTAGKGGFLDFHFAQATDATSVIRETASGTLSVNSVHFSNGKLSSSTEVSTGTLKSSHITFTPASNANHGGYLEFHYNGNSDVTSRIYEYGKGQLTINGVHIFNDPVNDVSSMQTDEINLSHIGFKPAASAGHGGYLEFHFGGKTAHTSRIAETEEGTLRINKVEIEGTHGRIYNAIHEFYPCELKRISEREDGNIATPVNWTLPAVYPNRPLFILFQAQGGSDTLGYAKIKPKSADGILRQGGGAVSKNGYYLLGESESGYPDCFICIPAEQEKKYAMEVIIEITYMYRGKLYAYQ